MPVCQHCHKPTDNPRFCNRSCAASYNNRVAPKRKKEGVCADCPTPIAPSQIRCPTCKAARRAQKEAAEAETRARAYATREAERAAAFHHPAPFQGTPDTSVQWVLKLMHEHWAELSARLAPDEALRYRVLLEDLYLFEQHAPSEDRLPIERIFPWLLVRWVIATTQPNTRRPRTAHPLLGMYRYAATEVFLRWAFGYRLGDGYDRQCGFIDATLYRDDRLAPSDLKELTQDIKGTLVTVALPDQVYLRWGSRVLAEPGVAVSGNLERFYASQTFYPDVRVDDPDHRWTQTLKIPIVLHACVEGHPDGYEPLPQPFAIPDTWIVECYENAERSAVWGAVDWADTEAALATLLRPTEIRKHQVLYQMVRPRW